MPLLYYLFSPNLIKVRTKATKGKINESRRALAVFSPSSLRPPCGEEGEAFVHIKIVPNCTVFPGLSRGDCAAIKHFCVDEISSRSSPAPVNAICQHTGDTRTGVKSSPELNDNSSAENILFPQIPFSTNSLLPN